MASEIGVQKLMHTNATQAATINSSGQLIIDDGLHKSEGGAVNTSIGQGIAKQWANLVGTGTAAIVDSLNTSSITDNGTGNYDFDLTNAFSTDDYSINVTGNYAGNFICVYNNTTFDTDGWNVRAFGYNGASLSDTNNCMTNCFGDLA